MCRVNLDWNAYFEGVLNLFVLWLWIYIYIAFIFIPCSNIYLSIFILIFIPTKYTLDTNTSMKHWNKPIIFCDAMINNLISIQMWRPTDLNNFQFYNARHRNGSKATIDLPTIDISCYSKMDIVKYIHFYENKKLFFIQHN